MSAKELIDRLDRKVGTIKGRIELQMGGIPPSVVNWLQTVTRCVREGATFTPEQGVAHLAAGAINLDIPRARPLVEGVLASLDITREEIQAIVDGETINEEQEKALNQLAEGLLALDK